MGKVADLHVHTNISDGTFSPEKAVGYAKLHGLDAIAITDHDVIDGIQPALNYIKNNKHVNMLISYFLLYYITRLTIGYCL